MTEPLIGNGNTSGITGADMLALVAHITELLAASERRIIDRLNENANGAEKRWAKHDAEAVKQLGAIREEIGVLRADFNSHLTVANVHFAREHDDDLVAQARIKPIKMSAAYAAKNWRTIALWVVLLLTMLGTAVERLYDAGVGK